MEYSIESSKELVRKGLLNPLESYIESIRDYPLLSEEEEREITKNMIHYRDQYLKDVFSVGVFLDFFEKEIYETLRQKSKVNEKDVSYILEKNPKKVSELLKKYHSSKSEKRKKELIKKIELYNDKRSERIFQVLNVIFKLENIFRAKMKMRSYIYHHYFEKFNKEIKKEFSSWRIEPSKLEKLQSNRYEELELKLLQPLSVFNERYKRINQNYKSYQKLREKMILSNLRLPIAVVCGTTNKPDSQLPFKKIIIPNGKELMDLIEIANMGLLDAIDVYDPSKCYKDENNQTKPVKFSSYAIWWIREALLRDTKSSDLIRIPECLYFKVRRSENRELKKIKKLNESLLSLEEIVGEKGRGIKDPKTSPPEYKEKIIEEKILPLLDEREAEIIRLRYFEEKAPSFEKIGEKFKISRERVRQIKKRAEEKIKKIILENYPECVIEK